MGQLNELHDSKMLLDGKTGEIEYITNKEYCMFVESKDKHFKGVGDGKSTWNPKSTDLLNEFISETCGSFYFNYYKNLESDQYAFRFIYLCTFMNYDGYLEFGNAKREGSLMYKKDLFEVLKLSTRETYNTIKYLEDNNLLEITDKFIKINSDICIKGTISSKKDVVRMFNNSIQDIYNNATAKEHKKLSLLIKLLPFIHFNSNTICKNPNCEYIDLIEPYTLTELSNLLGYCSTQSFKKGLMNLKVNGEFAIMISTINNKNVITVNPKVYYKGNDYDSMQGIVNIFKIAK